MVRNAVFLLVSVLAPFQTIIPDLPTDIPKLLTSTDLRQPNGRPINVHLVNSTTISTYILNQLLRRRNSIPNAQQQVEERERSAIIARHSSPDNPVEADKVDAERLAQLMGFANAKTRKAVKDLMQQEVELSQKQDSEFTKQSSADRLSAFEVINAANKKEGRIEFVRVRRSWETP